MSLGLIRDSWVKTEKSFHFALWFVLGFLLGLVLVFVSFYLMNSFASPDFEMGALLRNERLKCRT